MVAAPDDLRVEAFRDDHDRSAFSCGKATLDDYIHEQLDAEVRANSARAFALTAAGAQVLGFYTLSSSSIRLDLLSEVELGILPTGYPAIPTTLLGRFAVDRRAQGQGLGSYMLIDALKRSWAASENVGSWAIFVDTRDDDARKFYLGHEFIALLKQPAKMYMPTSTLGQLFG